MEFHELDCPAVIAASLISPPDSLCLFVCDIISESNSIVMRYISIFAPRCLKADLLVGGNVMESTTVFDEISLLVH